MNNRSREDQDPEDRNHDSSSQGDGALPDATSDLSHSQVASEPALALKPACDGDADASAAETPQLSDLERERQTTELLATFHDDVFRYAYRLTSSESLADDIVQETFIRVYKSVHQLKAPAAAKGWLLAIARNEFIRWCRRKKPTSSLDDQGEIDVPAVGGGERSIDNQEWVQEALGSVKEEHRIIVAMYYFEQLSYSEIAGQLDIPIGTVMSRLSRAKTSLRQQLLHTGGEDE